MYVLSDANTPATSMLVQYSRPRLVPLKSWTLVPTVGVRFLPGCKNPDRVDVLEQAIATLEASSAALEKRSR